MINRAVVEVFIRDLTHLKEGLNQIKSGYYIRVIDDIVNFLSTFNKEANMKNITLVSSINQIFSQMDNFTLEDWISLDSEAYKELTEDEYRRFNCMLEALSPKLVRLMIKNKNEL